MSPPGEGRRELDPRRSGESALNVLAKGAPDYKELNAKYGEKFQAQDLQSVRPLPAGMLGPVKLVTR